MVSGENEPENDQKEEEIESLEDFIPETPKN